MRYCHLLLPLFFLLLVSSTLIARTIYVPTESSTIQGAIGMAMDEDTVMVLPGTYYEHGIDFQGKAIMVTSTDPMDPSVVASTIIDANSEGTVVYFRNGEDTTSVLAGFTITGGYYGWGGGITSMYGASSPTIRRNVITENIAVYSGGGIHLGADIRPIISNNTITNNTVLDVHGSGGGIGISAGSDPIITNNVISNNSAAPDDLGWGGGIDIYAADAQIAGNTITGNSAGYGGGVCLNLSASAVITNTILWGNEAVTEGKEGYLGDEFFPCTVTISYSDVEGGQSSFSVGWGSTLIWGDGMVDTAPSFGGDGVHISANSPLRNAGDPGFAAPGETDIDGNARVLENRIDIGVDEIKVMRIRGHNPPVIIDPRTQMVLPLFRRDLQGYI